MGCPAGEAKRSGKGATTGDLCYGSPMRFVSAAILLLAGVAAGCRADPVANDSAENVQNAAGEKNLADAPALPTVSQPLSRRELLLAAAEAASDFAAGVNDTKRQRELSGQPFSLAIRFCEGDRNEALFRSSFDQESRVVRLQVRPDINASSPLIQQLRAPGIEAVEGFWIRKPWLLEPACPTMAPAAPATELPDAEAGKEASTETMQEQAEERPPWVPRVGIAEFHDRSSDRSIRRGDRPYEVTKRLPEGARVGPVDMLIKGRLRALTTGKVIVCTGGSATMPPTCVISARVDAVSLRQTGGDVLGEWRGF